MSVLTDEGVMAVKNAACERLVEQRVEIKMKSKKINDCLNRFQVALPSLVTTGTGLLSSLGLSWRLEQLLLQRKRRNFERDLENENQGAGVYSASLKKHYILANYEWKEDILPEILDEHNVADILDPDILERCEELEREEGLRLKRGSCRRCFHDRWP
ncbi:hypothetical protein QYE76_020049 [Lolium multiflorum]|uniref:NOG C-terminal domain-containing protein n=1 Tax=Lolium multiflorum TaxID=4521 RepID=A0AAD8R697_LOLMU|nr:hypothetical protein QYE76_020049 [Lolium multiflorum]